MSPAQKQIKDEIIEAYLFLRSKNMTIPSETLEFMKDSALKALEPDIIKIESFVIEQASYHSEKEEESVENKDYKEALYHTTKKGCFIEILRWIKSNL